MMETRLLKGDPCFFLNLFLSFSGPFARLMCLFAKKMRSKTDRFVM